MSFQPGANLYTQGFGSRPESVEVPHIEVRDPSPTDVNYPIGKRWLNTASEQEFILYSFQSISGITQAVWGTSVGATTAVLSLQDGVDAKVFPDSTGSIEINGTAFQIFSTSSPSSHLITLSLTSPLNIPGGLNANLGTVNLATTSNSNVSIGNSAAATQVVSIQAGDITIGTNGSPAISIGSANSISQVNGEITFSQGLVSAGSSVELHPTVLADSPLAIASSSGNLVGPVTYNSIGCESVFNCDSSAGAITINLPTVISPGTIIMVYDSSGSAGTNNIIINAPSGSNFFQGGFLPVPTFTFTHNYESATFIISAGGSNVIVLSHENGL